MKPVTKLTAEELATEIRTSARMAAFLEPWEDEPANRTPANLKNNQRLDALMMRILECTIELSDRASSLGQ